VKCKYDNLGEGVFKPEGCSAIFLHLDMEGNCLGDLLGWAVLKQLFKYLCAPQDFQRAHLLSHKQPAA